MRMLIQTPLPALGYELAADLEARGFGPVEVRTEESDTFEVRHRRGLSAAVIARLLRALEPLQPEEVGVSDDLGDADLVLRLGVEGTLGQCAVELHADSEPLLAQAGGAVSSVGLGRAASRLGVQDANQLHHNGGHLLARQLLRWALGRKGLTCEEVEHSEWGEDNRELQLRLCDPAQAHLPLRERFEVEVASDDPAVAARLCAQLVEQGFRCRPALALPERPEVTRFSLHPGPFGADRAPADLARLRVAADTLLGWLGVDAERFPLQVTGRDDGPVARLELPLAARAAGKLRPYAGPDPSRFDVTLHTDSPGAVTALVARLNEAGFSRVQISEVGSLVDDPDVEMPLGFQIQWGAAARQPAVSRALRGQMEAHMESQGASPTFALAVVEQFGDEDTDVYLWVPVKGVADGSLAQRLGDPARFRLRLYVEEKAEWADLEMELRQWGFDNIEIQTPDRRARKRLDYGGAPLLLVERLQAEVERRSGVRVTPRRQWPATDHDVWLHLPRRAQPAAADPSSETTVDLSRWVRGDEAAARSFLDLTTDQVRVGEVRLPRRGPARGPFVPALESFDHFCLDNQTAETLEHLAASVLLREPCLLEGETSTSKTSSVLYLAALLRQPVVRLNLNGQTDTGELIGRYVPRDEVVDEWAGPFEAPADLAEANGTVVREEAAVRAGPWRWQDGLVVQALRQGWWVLLDEVNLAEPQILERLNSVLEAEPSLVLTEHDNSALGRSGEPVHPQFRIFATMNPAEYAGRSVLSPAYRDRWRGYRYVPRPGEQEYLAMLRLLLRGEQPEASASGRRYQGGRVPARFAELSPLLSDRLLVGLARFQVALEAAAGQGGDAARLGARRKERYVFTRRGLLSVLDYLASPLGVGLESGDGAVRSALLRYYVGRVTAAEDRTVVARLLDAAGIGPNSWSS